MAGNALLLQHHIGGPRQVYGCHETLEFLVLIETHEDISDSRLPTLDLKLWIGDFFGRNIILMVTVGKEAWQRKNDEEVETIKIKEQGEWINTFEEGIKRKRVNGNEGQNLKTLIQRVLHYLKGKLKQKNQFPVWRQSLVNPEVTQHFITWFV